MSFLTFLLLAVAMARPVRTLENHVKNAKSPKFQFSCFSHSTVALKNMGRKYPLPQLIRVKVQKDVLVFSFQMIARLITEIVPWC